MPQDHPSHPYALAAVGILLAGIGYETFRLFVPWPNVRYAMSATVSLGLIVVWSATAASLLARRVSTSIAAIAWVLSFAAPLLMLLHGFAGPPMTRSFAAIVYVPLALLLGVFLKQTWDGHEYWRLRGRGLREQASS
jgi:hypothetical protein